MAIYNEKKADKLRKNAKSKSYDLVFIFKNIRVKTLVDTDEVSEDDYKKILDIVKHFCKEIAIDKSYVDYKGTKYEKTFIKEEGWNELCKLVIKTDFGSKCSAEQFDEMIASYGYMILCYLYQILKDFGYDTNYINIEIEDGTKFMVEYHEDPIQEWKYYVGKWQNWKTRKK